jgi:protein-tyrosine phosphatase
MTQVWERLFLGGLNDAKRLAKGNPHRIDMVISLCETSVASKRRGVSYVHIPIADDQPVSVGDFDRIMDAIAENVRWGIVLVHCGVGISRAPSMTAAWMATVGYKNIDAAIEEIRLVRPFIAPSTVLLNSVKEHLK